MNRNMIVMGLVVSCITLGVFLKPALTAKKSEVPAVVSTETSAANSVAPEAGKAAVEGKAEVPAGAFTIDESEVLNRLQGLWISKNAITKFDRKTFYQLEFIKAKNPELMGGKLVYGSLFSYDDDNLGRQSYGGLELESVNGNIAKFVVKEKDVANYYDGANFNIESNIIEVIVTFTKEGQTIALVDNSNGSFDIAAESIKLDNFTALLKKWSGVYKSTGDKISMDLSKIKDISEDFGTYKVKSSDCSGESKVRVRPITQKLLLVSTGRSTFCMESLGIKILADTDSTAQGIAYKNSYPPVDVSFTK